MDTQSIITTVGTAGLGVVLAWNLSFATRRRSGWLPVFATGRETIDGPFRFPETGIVTMSHQATTANTVNALQDGRSLQLSETDYVESCLEAVHALIISLCRAAGSATGAEKVGIQARIGALDEISARINTSTEIARMDDPELRDFLQTVWSNSRHLYGPAEQMRQFKRDTEYASPLLEAVDELVDAFEQAVGNARGSSRQRLE